MERFAEIGMKACLPGMQYLFERIGKELAEFQSMLKLMDELGGPRKVGRPRNVIPAETSIVPAIEAPEFVSVRRSIAQKSSWAKMTPEERSAEMSRRRAVGQAKKTAKLHPRHPDHPEHEAWKGKLAQGRKDAWARKSKAQKAAWLAQMNAGKAKRAKAARKNAVVTMAATA
jgi:hypothetical protein